LTIDVALVRVRNPMDRLRWMRRVCKVLNMRQMCQMREMG
jgi:hypothetical protein